MPRSQSEADAKPLVYVGSSWKNAASLDAVHEALTARGFNTYDFRKQGFWWADVDPKYRSEDPYNFLDAPESQEAFRYDLTGLNLCIAGVFILPAGVSTALECGYMSGQGKPTFIWGPPREDRLDIMWKVTSFQFSHKLFTLDEMAHQVLRHYTYNRREWSHDVTRPQRTAG